MAKEVDIEKLDRLTKLLNARETLNKFPSEYNDLQAVLAEECKQLGRDLGINPDKTQPVGAAKGDIPNDPSKSDVTLPNRGGRV